MCTFIQSKRNRVTCTHARIHKVKMKRVLKMKRVKATVQSSQYHHWKDFNYTNTRAKPKTKVSHTPKRPTEHGGGKRKMCMPGVTAFVCLHLWHTQLWEYVCLSHQLFSFNLFFSLEERRPRWSIPPRQQSLTHMGFSNTTELLETVDEPVNTDVCTTVPERWRSECSSQPTWGHVVSFSF